jgi:hypothetical protein
LKRKLRNWAIGFLLAVLAFSGAMYFLMDFAVDKVLEQMVPDSAVVEQTSGTQSSLEKQSSKKTQQTGDSEQLNPLKEGKQVSKEHQLKDVEFDYQADVTTERSETVENAITVDEKILITSIMLNQFNAEELQWFRKLAAGGLSTDEKKEMRALFFKKLTPEQYDRLIEIAKKYGVSQGKKHAEYQNIE